MPPPARARTLADETPMEKLARETRTQLLRAGRLARWYARPEAFGRPKLAEAPEVYPHLVYARSLPIGRTDAAADPLLEEGKRANLALAAPAFDGLLVEPGSGLSFWRVLGRVTEADGYRWGLELRGGCLVPAIGGGLCLLTNALFELAVRLGWRIDERHGHSLEAVPPPAGEPWGLDAAVLWPYVDLRVTPVDAPVRLSVQVGGASLLVAAHAREPARSRSELVSLDDRVEEGWTARRRRNRLLRRVFRVSDGSLERSEIVAENGRRLLHDVEQRRTCRICTETGCRSRVTPPDGAP